MTNMKVLFIISDANLNGGTELLAFNLLHELNKNGIECNLLSINTYTGNDPDVISLSHTATRGYCMLFNSPVDKLSGHIFSDIFLRTQIHKIVSDGRFDWIVNHTYDLCTAIPKHCGVRTVQVFNWSITGYERSVIHNIRQKSKFNAFLSYICFQLQLRRWHKSIPYFDRLVTLTDSAHKEIEAIAMHIMDNRILTIPNPLMANNPVKKVSSLHNGNAVFVGRLSHEKGVMRLMRIWRQVHSELSHYNLKVYGTGACLDEMLDFVRNSGDIGVMFMGFCPDKEQIYKDADLLLMTSDREGFGMVLTEAMYYGVPCIAFDCPVSPKEIIADAGVTVTCYDENQYAQEVIHLLSDEERLKNLQLKAIRRAQDFYISTIMTQWKAIFNC